MNSLNVVGYLGRNAEKKFITDGTPVLKFNLAVNRPKTKKNPNQDPLWFEGSLFGKQADSLEPYMLKGKQIAVQGEFGAREWTDREGQKHTILEINARQITLLGGKPENSREPGEEDFPTEEAPKDEEF